MEKRKKDCPAVGAVGQSMDRGANHHESSLSTSNCITPTADRQPFRVADLLLAGAENAATRRDLMALTGYKDRELRRLIEAERRQGIPILSDCKSGYFLPGDQAERDRCVRSLRSRAAEILATADAIERAVLPD